MCKPSILYPACGTFSISIFPLAPTNKILTFGFLLLISSAIAIAGKICPPVPPPEITTRSIIVIYLSAFGSAVDSSLFFLYSW